MQIFSQTDHTYVNSSPIKIQIVPKTPLHSFRISSIPRETAILTLTPQISFPYFLYLASFTQRNVSRLIYAAIHKFSLFFIIANIAFQECITVINEHV